MKRVFFMAVMVSILAVSCNKDDDSYQTDVTPTDYMQLKIGNYWVYQTYRTDTLGNEYPEEIYDSIVITGDTVINGITYYTKHNFKQDRTEYMRDSSGYLVNDLGKVFFSNHDFTNILRIDTIGPGLAVIEYKMIEGYTIIAIPIGRYESLEFKGTVTPMQSSYPHGTQYTFYFWVDGIGLIKSDYYFYNNPKLRAGWNLIAYGNVEESN